MASKKLIATLKEKAAAVQVIVQEVPNLEAAFTYALAVTQAQGGATLAAPGWDAAKPGGSWRPTAAGPGWSCWWRICGSGPTPCIPASPGPTGASPTPAPWCWTPLPRICRLATMLVETHVAVLPVSRLRATVTDLEEEMTRLMAAPPSYLAFITGASRTADIERVLTLGVHGPLELHLLLLKD